MWIELMMPNFLFKVRLGVYLFVVAELDKICFNFAYENLFKSITSFLQLVTCSIYVQLAAIPVVSEERRHLRKQLSKVVHIEVPLERLLHCFLKITEFNTVLSVYL